MNYVVIVFTLTIVGGGAYWLISKNMGKPSINYSKSTLIFEKSESWGPCSDNEKCFKKTLVYSNGRFVLEGEKDLERNIGIKNIDRFIKAIKDSGVISKKCEGPTALDYEATYKIYLDNTITTITFPNCREELKEVDNLLQSFRE